MTDEKLDAVLRRAAEPEPADDGFTDTVMARARSRRNGRVRRWITRPAVLAAAAVLITGGALAAVRTAQEPREAAAPLESVSSTPEADVETPAVRPSPVVAGDASTTERETAATDPDERRSHREGDLEWGYRSPHTAYVIDHGAGLQLVTETQTNSVDAGTPHRVTLTLTNVGDEPVGVYAPEGCALTATAFEAREGERDPSGYEDPRTAKDPSGARVWNCAGEGDRPSEDDREPEKFVLRPGEARTESAVVVLSGGDWALLGRCECGWARPGEEATPKPTTKPTDGGLLGLTSPPEREPSTTERSTKDWRLFTPPIRIAAR